MKSVFLTGASGVGKTTTYHSLIEYGFEPSPNYITRLPRHDEIDGLDAYYVSKEAFADKLTSGLLLEESMEQADYLGVYYGSPRSWINAVEINRPPILAIPANVLILRGLCEALDSRGVRQNAAWVNLYADYEVRQTRISDRVTDPNVLIGRLSSGVSQGIQPDADLNIDTGKMSIREVIEQISTLALDE